MSRAVFHEKASYQRKDEICRFNGSSILHEIVEASRTCCGRIRNKHGDRKTKTRVKIMKIEGRKLGEMSKQEALGSKLSEKYTKYLIIQKMCSAGEFKFTKFISSNKSVMMSIPINCKGM